VAAHLREALVSAVLAEALREVLEFFRRRESFWLLVGFGAGCAAPLAVLASGPGIAGSGVSEAFALSQVRFAAELAHNYTSVLELVALVVLAYVLASRSLGEEIERGSWLLMRLTPAGVERTLGGKALGIAVVLAAVHGLSTSLLLMMTPFLRRTHAEVALSTLGVLLVAIAAIPEGFAHASLGSGMPGGPAAFRLLAIVRVALLLAALAILFGPHLQPRLSLRPDLPYQPLWADVVIYWLSRPGRGPDAGGSVWRALPPWVLSLSWLALSGATLWRLVVRRWRSADR
jgi:hypothetical protein